MNHRHLLVSGLLLATLLLHGCASTPDIAADVETRQPPPALIVPKLPPLPPGASRVNGIAAIVNDDVITFREVLRESQPVILDAQKKGLVDDKARHDLRVMVLDRLIDKYLTEQKVKELGIRIGDEEIRQAIDDVKRQNNSLSGCGW